MMITQVRTLDSEALYQAMEHRRRELNISWHEVTRQAGMNAISASRRLREGHSLSADGLILLMRWLGTTDVTPFTVKPSD